MSSSFACIPYFIKTVFEFWCIGLSFVTLALVTLERYLAVFKPFRYRATVTQSHVMRVILSGWIVWTVFSFSLRFSSNGMNLKAYSILSFILISFTLLETVFVYINSYTESPESENMQLIAIQPKNKVVILIPKKLEPPKQ